MKKENLRYAAAGAFCLLLVLVYNNCSRQLGGYAPGLLPVPPAGLALQPYVCGSATFPSDHYTMNASINGQNNWFVDPAANFDEKIENVGSDACRGQGVWHISNSVVSGGFGNQPASPAFVKASGESSVRSPGAGDSMGYSFFFRTKSASADGSAMTVSLSPTSADRHDYIRLMNDLDSKNGFQIYVVDGAGLVRHDVALNITRGVWHHLRLENTNPDGGGNDVVQLYLDGTLISTHTTWEDWRTALPATTLAVTRLLFRMSALASAVDASFTASPGGFYIDDLEQYSYDSSAPSVRIESYVSGFEN